MSLFDNIMNQNPTLRERRQYLAIAMNLLEGHKEDLFKFEADYKKKREKILFKIFLDSVLNNIAKRERMTARLESFAKVIILLFLFRALLIG